MSEPIQSEPPRQAVEPMPGSTSAGALLKAARESQGLHVGILAVMLKVPVHKLEALEADRFDELVDMVFTRALASSVCRALKIDPAAVLAALPQSETRRVKASLSGLNTPMKTGRFALGEQLGPKLTSPLGLAVGLLVLGIFVIVLWPEIKTPAAWSTDTVGVAATEPSQVITSVVPALTASSTTPVQASALSPAPQDQASVAQEAAVISTAAAVSAIPAAAANQQAPILILQASGSSWVEVTDAKGVVQVRKIMEPGEQVQFGGDLPLSVVLGRSDQVAVSVRGQPLDLTGLSKANVARFEVK